MSTKPFIRARDIAAHLTTLLAGISKADGYETDIGLRVFRGKRKIDDSHIPCAVIIEGEDKPGGTQGGASQQVTLSQARLTPAFPQSVSQSRIHWPSPQP